MADLIENLAAELYKDGVSPGAAARELAEMLQSSPRLQDLLNALLARTIEDGREIMRLRKGVHASDCSKHDAPALPVGKCSCGLHLLDEALQAVEYWKHQARTRNDLYLGALESLGKLVEGAYP